MKYNNNTITYFIIRFSIYGACIMGPSMFVWIRIATSIWPRTNFRSSISKALTELCCYDPVSICTFMFVMSLLENKTIAEAEDEVSKTKYTYIFYYTAQ